LIGAIASVLLLVVVNSKLMNVSAGEPEEFCLPPLELGVYIRYFMLDEDERAWWTMRADEYSLVEWLTDDVEYDEGGWKSQRR